jgi:hypothetical protein
VERTETNVVLTTFLQSHVRRDNVDNIVRRSYLFDNFFTDAHAFVNLPKYGWTINTVNQMTFPMHFATELHRDSESEIVDENKKPPDRSGGCLIHAQAQHYFMWSIAS